MHEASFSYSLSASVLTGQVLECSIAKPQADQKTPGASNAQKGAIFPAYPPRVGYGLVGSPYGGLNAGYSGAGYAQVKMPYLSCTSFYFYCIG